jgi:hypothetical protein
VLAHIALNQVFVEEFHIFGVRRGGRLKFVNEDVAGMISRYQWIYEGRRIGPERLVDLGHWRAVAALDQLVPFSAGAFEFPAGMPERVKAMLREQMSKGFLLPNALAYPERALRIASVETVALLTAGTRARPRSRGRDRGEQ